MATARDITRNMQTLNVADNTIPPSRDIDGNARLVRHLVAKYKNLKCREPTCKAPLPLSSVKEHIKNWLAGAKGDQPAQISGIYCRRCRKWTCIGCRGKPALGRKTIKTADANINHCCSQGRLFGVWLLLCRFDEVELQLRERAAENARKDKHRVRKNDGTGYHDTDGEPSYSFSDESEFKDEELKYRKEDDLTDNLMTGLLRILTVFMPVAGSESSFDRTPPAQLYSLLRLSLLLDRVVSLLRNDAIADMAQRKYLYYSVLDSVNAIGSRSMLVRLLIEQRTEKKRSPGLQKLGEASSQQVVAMLGSRPQMVASLVECSGNTIRQVKAYANLTSLPVMAKDMSRASDGEIKVCGKIIEFYITLKRTAPEAIQHLKSGSKDPWTSYCEANRVTFTDDVLVNHTLREKWSEIKESPFGRMAALAKEIANLKTSLPPGIFVKIADRRPDVMKILIGGVEGTPYSGGLFMFDMYLPLKWPQEPPVIFMTLDEGLDRSVHMCQNGEIPFNPNIHPDGVVCLSLINTWPAKHPSEKWIPGKSTLLSVFVSIQAMLLGVPNPLDNNLSKWDMGEDYNTKHRHIVQSKTVYYAILFWLMDDRGRKGIWGDVVKMYWKYKGREVVRQVREWAKSNPRLRSFDKKSPYSDTETYGPKVDLVNTLERY